MFDGLETIRPVREEPSSARQRSGLASLPVNIVTATTNAKPISKESSIPPPPPLPDLARKRFAPTHAGSALNLNVRRSRSNSPREVPFARLSMSGSLLRPPLAGANLEEPTLSTPISCGHTTNASAFQRALSPLRTAPNPTAARPQQADSQQQLSTAIALSYSDTFGSRTLREALSSSSVGSPELLVGAPSSYVKHLQPLPKSTDDSSSPLADPPPPPPPRAAHHVIRSCSVDSWATDSSDEINSCDAALAGTPPRRYPSEPALGGGTKVLDKYHFLKTFSVEPKTPGSMDKKLRRLMVEPSVRNPQQCLVRRATQAPATPPQNSSPIFKRHSRYRFRNALSSCSRSPKPVTSSRGDVGVVTPHAARSTSRRSLEEDNEEQSAPPLGTVEAGLSAMFLPSQAATQLTFDDDDEDDEGEKAHSPLNVNLLQLPLSSKEEATTAGNQLALLDEGAHYRLLKPLTPARVPPPPARTGTLESMSSAAPKALSTVNPRGRLSSITPSSGSTLLGTSTSADAPSLTDFRLGGGGGVVLGRRRPACSTIRNIAPLSLNVPLPVLLGQQEGSVAPERLGAINDGGNSELADNVNSSVAAQRSRHVQWCETHGRFILSLQRDLMMYHSVGAFVQEVKRLNADIDSNTLSLSWWWRQATGSVDEGTTRRQRTAGYTCEEDQPKCWYIPARWQETPSSLGAAPTSSVFADEWGTLDGSTCTHEDAPPSPQRALFDFTSF